MRRVVIGQAAAGGETVLEALRRLGLGAAVEAPCGGAGTCGKCRVGVRRPGEAEAHEALACQMRAEEGMEVMLLEEAADWSEMDVSLRAACTQTAFLPDAGADGLGLAFDVGTTTIVCRLHDLHTGRLLADAGAANPQRAFGADVIARISAAMDGRLDELAQAACSGMAALAEEVLAAAGRSGHDVSRVALCGNTVMEHLVAGINPEPIGSTPFMPPTLFGSARPWAALAQAAVACNEALFAPCVAGYVGGDITCDLLALGMASCADPVLLVDLGTNGEMALSCAGGITTCATAAGPVFEGANIRFGMPAYPGAISCVRLVGGRLEVRTIGDAPVRGICGTGLIDAVALLLDAGVLDESGLLMEADEVDGEVPEAIRSRLGECEGAAAFWITPEAAVTQRDVRNIQLAKAAIRAGILTLVEDAGLQLEEVSCVHVAGGFGQFLDLRNAARIGLVPAELLGVAHVVGNVAIEGISAALMSAAAREELTAIAQACGYLELSNSAAFNEAYLDAMEFPEAP